MIIPSTGRYSNGNNLEPRKQVIDNEETHRLVGDGELAQVVSNHLRLDLNLEEKSYDI